MINTIVIIKGHFKPRNRMALKIAGDDYLSLDEITGYITRQKLRYAADKTPDSAASIKKMLTGYVPTFKHKNYTVYHKRVRA